MKILELPTVMEKKKFITLFMIIVFSLLLVMSAYIENYVMRLWFQAILFIAQLVIVNAILTDYYS